MIKRVFVVSIISLILLSTFALAAGSSSAGVRSNTNTCQTDSDCVLKLMPYCCGDSLEAINKCYSINQESPTTPVCTSANPCPGFSGPPPTSCSCINSICIGRPSTNNQGTATTCEDKETLKDRIKCRFENKEVAIREAVDAIEEACRSSADEKKERCRQFYKNSAKCFNSANAVEKKKCFLKESGININAGGTFRAAPDETKRNYVVLLLYELQEKIEAKQEQGKITTDQATS
ncbi:MAG: hypothetical protein AABX95_01195, partial [Nanoarchaeota archaeon]